MTASLATLAFLLFQISAHATTTTGVLLFLDSLRTIMEDVIELVADIVIFIGIATALLA